MADTLDRAERDAALRGADRWRSCAAWRVAAGRATCGGTQPRPSSAMDRRPRGSSSSASPGNSEDLEGAPFVGPAGQLLDRALVESGIDRATVYVTNVVKHFKWRRAPSGKRRIHQKPDRAEIEACYPWLAAEVSRIRPELIVCLGATAGQSVLGRAFRVTRQHGEVLPSELGPAMGTLHPSAVLRAPDEDARRAMQEQLIDDLRAAASWLAAPR